MIYNILNRLENNIVSFNNNSLSIRFILAFLVFYSHMFAIYGLLEPTLLWSKHSLGWYSVNGFFFISGLLVAQSYQNKSIFSYTMARFLRIMPAYVLSLFVVLFCVFFFSNIHFSDEWLLKFRFFLSHNFIPLSAVDTFMAGTWNYTSQPGALNNSLWTIPFEIFCYIVVIPFFLTNKKYTIRIAFILMCIILFYVQLLGAISYNSIRLDLIRVIVYFGIGSTTYLIIKNKRINVSFIVLCIFLFFVEGSLKEMLLGFLIILGILFFGFYIKNIFNFQDDYSYGLYLYAWPISQAVNGGEFKMCIMD